MRNATAMFQIGRIAVNLRFGYDIAGMILHSYFKADGDVREMTSGLYAVSPFIPINGLATDISITLSFAGYTDPPVDAVFYSSEDASTIVGVYSSGSSGRHNITIPKASVPATARYMRVCCASGSTVQSTDANDVTVVQFDKVFS